MEAAPGKVAQGLLAAAQHHIYLDPVTLLQERHRLAGRAFEVVARCFQVNAEHLYLRDMPLFRPVFALLSGFGILELAEVHDLDHRRVCGRCNLDDIKPPFLGDAEGLFEIELPEILTVFINGADARGADLDVDAVAADEDVVALGVCASLVRWNCIGDEWGSQRFV